MDRTDLIHLSVDEPLGHFPFGAFINMPLKSFCVDINMLSFLLCIYVGVELLGHI